MATKTLTGSYQGANASNYDIKCECSSTSNGSVANTSNVTVNLYMRRNKALSSPQWNELDATAKIIIDGTDSGYVTVKFDTRNSTDWILLTTYTKKNIAHNSDGSKTINVKAYFNPNSTSTLTNGYVNGDFTLDKIPRYATCVQSLHSRTETTITMNWSSDSVCDYIWYSKDNGATWTGINVTDGKSGTYTISNLPIYTLFKIKTRVRRKDSQLTTDSSASSIATYNYPYCTSSPNFTIGDALKIEFYNPLGRQISWQVLGADGSLIAGNSTTGTSYTGINGDGSVANLYKSIPNVKSGTYSVKVTYGTITRTRTEGVYSIRGTEYPTINAFTYKDNNSTTVGITGNNQHIVQNYSTLLAQVGNATANKGAGGIAKYVVECNGKKVEKASSGDFSIGAVNSANNLDLKLTVTDTRGLSSSKTIKVTMLAHSQPTAVVTLERLNNYEDETYLTVDGSVASVNSKNTMAIKYRYKQSGGAYGSYVNTADRQKNTLSLNKNNSYIFNVVVTDAFGSTFSKEYVLDKGMFPLFIDTAKNSVGINCFPVNEQSLEVNGLDISTIKELKKTIKLNANAWTNVGINYTDLASGTYVMEIFINHNTSAISNQFGERISGILSWYSLTTNSTNTDVIPVSKSGHARNNHNIQVRVARTTTATGEGYLRLQMMDDVAWNGEGEVLFRFKRLI